MLLFLGSLSDLPPQFFIAAILGTLAALLIGMTVHEWAHNYVAHLMGDPMPKRWGRLTLNPMVHIYWPGFIMVLLIGYGTLGTAPIDPARMRNPRLGYLLAVGAGPVSNLVLAILASIIYRILDSGVGEAVLVVQFSLYFVILFNSLLFVFNLLPLAPLDGWSIMYTLLPPREAMWWERNRQNSQSLFFILILISFAIPQFSILGTVVSDPVFAIQRFLIGI